MVEKVLPLVSEIEEGIFLGGIPFPTSDPPGSHMFNNLRTPHIYIKDRGIRKLISFTDERVHWNIPQGAAKYIHIVMKDSPDVNIEKFFWPITCQIRDSKRRGEKVLIHCHMGVSRSATALAAYYIIFGLPHNPRPTVEQAISFIREKRPFINPNPGFMEALYKLHKRVSMGFYSGLSCD